MTTNNKIISLGDLVLDIILPVSLPLMAEHHQSVPYRRVEPGGAGNFIVAAKRMGADVHAAGAVGDDLFGTFITDGLAQEGINIEHIYTMPNATSTVVMALTDQRDGRHTFVGHYGKSVEVPYPVNYDAEVESAGAIFYQGHTLNERSFVPFTQKAVQHANEKGIPVYFDVGPLFANVPTQLRNFTLETTDVFMMTQDEAQTYISTTVGGTNFRSLLERRARMLVIKQGENGCTIITQEGETHYPAYSVPVVDTVGAGDCFDAAFVAMQLEGRSLDETARIANAMGAAAVQKIIAGRQAPNCKEVNYILIKEKTGLKLTCS